MATTKKAKAAGKKKVAVKKREKSSREMAAAPPRGMREPFANLRKEIDRVFEEFMEGGSHLWSRLPNLLEDFEHPLREIGSSLGIPAMSPNVDVTENDEAYIVSAELPGLEEDDIELTLSEGMLTLKGEKQEEKREEEKNYFLSERRYGSFRRSFRIPEGVDDSKVSADLSNGLLSVTLPKTAQAKKKARKIEVKKT